MQPYAVAAWQAGRQKKTGLDSGEWKFRRAVEMAESGQAYDDGAIAAQVVEAESQVDRVETAIRLMKERDLINLNVAQAVIGDRLRSVEMEGIVPLNEALEPYGRSSPEFDEVVSIEDRFRLFDRKRIENILRKATRR